MGEADKISWNIVDRVESRGSGTRTIPNGILRENVANGRKPTVNHGISTRNPISSPGEDGKGDVDASKGVHSGTSARDVEAQSEKPPAIGPDGQPTEPPPKTSLVDRVKNTGKRFGFHAKDAIFRSWINVLLIFVPIGIAVDVAGLNPAVVFAMNAVAIVPLAGMLAYATESVASRLGDTLAALLNMSFGNAVELIIFIIALAKNEIAIVQASLLGSILANLLLVLGMSFLLGGLLFREQIYNSTITQMSAVMLSLSVMSLLLPTAFHASFANDNLATTATSRVSRSTSIVLLVIYFLYLTFQLKSHRHLYESTPQHIIDEESYPGVLHDVLHQSSSSEWSGSESDTDSDSDSSIGSRSTAKRIKRAFSLKRRKSSISSKYAGSLPSLVSSPSAEHDQLSLALSRRTSTLNPGQAGDDVDADDERAAAGTTIRDFEQQGADRTPAAKPKHKKKHRKHHHRHHLGHRNRSSSRVQTTELNGVDLAALSGAPQQQPVEGKSGEKGGDEQREAIKKPFSILRPPMAKVFSESPVEVPKLSTTSTVPYGPRRVRSLPDMNAAQAGAAAPAKNAAPSALPPSNDPLIKPAEDEKDKEIYMSRKAAVILLLCSTGLVAVCAEFLVDAIPEMTANSSVSQTFIGLIILPMVGNAAEFFTAVTMAMKNKVDLSIGVSVGSSIQVSLFMTPVVILLGWAMDREITLFFNIFEVVSVFATVFVVNFLVLDGRSNYLEGALLLGAYVIIGVASFFYPDEANQSVLGGSDTQDAVAIVTRSIAAMF